MHAGRWELVFHYAMAACFCAFALIILDLIKPLYVEHAPPLVFLCLAITASAWRGGAGPGYFATLLCVLGARQWLIPAEWLASVNPAESLRLLFTGLTGIAISALAGALHRARRVGVRSN